MGQNKLYWVIVKKWQNIQKFFTYYKYEKMIYV